MGDNHPSADPDALLLTRHFMTDESDDPLLSSVDAHDLPDITESMRLVEQAQGGSREALNELLRRYEPRLRRIVRIRLSTKLRRVVDSVDIIQETYRSAFGKIGTLELRSTASILQWLSRIAENQMIDTHRHFYGAKRNRDREVPLQGPVRSDSSRDESPMFLPAADGITPAEEVSRRELHSIVDEAVAELPDDYREVIMLRTYLGGSWDFVTKEMGRPNAEATRQLHRRARIRLSRLVRSKIPGAVDDD